jgi:hypothetical protein
MGSIPFDYGKKKLVTAANSTTPRILLEGMVDLLPEELTPTQEISIPLCTTSDLYRKLTVGHAPRAREGAAGDSSIRKLLRPAGTEVGQAIVKLNVLK